MTIENGTPLLIINPSLENATPSSSTFPVAYYEEVYLLVVPVEVTRYMDGLFNSILNS